MSDYYTNEKAMATVDPLPEEKIMGEALPDDIAERRRSSAPPQELKASMGWLEILAAGFMITNSWIGVGSALALSLAAQGGPVTLVYGLIISLFVGGATALSLAELAAKYPTAGGQYHWTAVLAPKSLKRGLSYICGILNIFDWIATCTFIGFIEAQFITALVIFYNPTYEYKNWHVFLEFLLVTIIAFLINIFIIQRATFIYNFAFFLSVSLFLITTVSCLVMSDTKQRSEFVWEYFYNGTGWSNDGIVFLIGLINPSSMVGGIDGAIHLAEDVTDAAVAVPRALMTVVGLGFTTSFIFVVAMLYSLQDFSAVSSALLPLFEIWAQATNRMAAVAFVVIVLVMTMIGCIAAIQTSSRLTWSFARDDILFGSKYIGSIHPKLGVPVYAIIFNTVICVAIGAIYAGSSTAFGAILASQIVMQQLCFGIPVLLLLCTGRASEHLPKKGFRLGVFGWTINIVTVGWTALSSIVFILPYYMPVTATNMNYTCAVLGGVGIFGIINWIFYSRKRYFGPVIDVGAKGF